MRVVYIAGKFRGANAWQIEQNVRAAERCGMDVAERGAMPLIPHANTRFFHGTVSDEFWLEGTMELLRRCDAVMLVVDWQQSTGARMEVEEARRLGKPVFEFLAELSSWLNAPAARRSPTPGDGTR